MLFDLTTSELVIRDALEPLSVLLEASQVIRSAVGLGLDAIEGSMRHQDFDDAS